MAILRGKNCQRAGQKASKGAFARCVLAFALAFLPMGLRAQTYVVTELPLPETPAQEQGGDVFYWDLEALGQERAMEGRERLWGTYTAAPTIETMRVDFEGKGLLAGRVRAFSSVGIYIDDRFATEMQANEAGRFAGFFTLPEGDDAHLITIFEETRDGIYIDGRNDILFRPRDIGTVFAKARRGRGYSLNGLTKFLRPQSYKGDGGVERAPKRPEAPPSKPILIEDTQYRDDRFFISGSAKPLQRMQVYMNDIYQYDITAGVGGEWRFESVALPVGENTFTFVKVAREMPVPRKFLQLDDARIFVREIPALPLAMRQGGGQGASDEAGFVSVIEIAETRPPSEITQTPLLWDILPMPYRGWAFDWAGLSAFKSDTRAGGRKNPAQGLASVFQSGALVQDP